MEEEVGRDIHELLDKEDQRFEQLQNALKVAKAARSPGRDELLKTFCDAELIFKHSLAYDLKRHKVRLCLCDCLAAAASSFRD